MKLLTKQQQEWYENAKICHCHYTGEQRSAAHSICKYEYHFIIKELAEESKKQFICLGENTEKYITFTVPIEKEVKRTDKKEKKFQKIYLTYYNLLIVLDLWQAHYQILFIIYLIQFTELNVN